MVEDWNDGREDIQGAGNFGCLFCFVYLYKYRSDMAQEKLIVKNFGPIKEAELELGKVTVFIGEQASGKSVLAKLVAILKIFDSPKPESYFQEKIAEYSIQSFLNETSYILFENDFYRETYSSNKFNLENKNNYEEVLDNVLEKTKKYATQIELFGEEISLLSEKLNEISKDVKDLKEKVDESQNKVRKDIRNLKEDIDKSKDLNESIESLRTDTSNMSDIISGYLNEISSSLGIKIPKIDFQAKLIMNESEKKIIQQLHYPVYIPAERILISLISSTLISFINNNILLPKYILNFAELYTKAKLSNIKPSGFSLFKFELENEIEYIEYKNSKIKLGESSTGFQSLLPILMAIEYEKSEKLFQNRTPFFPKNFILEEPELSLYPTNQKELVNYLVEKCTKNNDHLILTTHSPYILSSLDNLIQAGNVVKKHPELAAEVEKIIPAKYHLNYEDVKVYFVADGKARLIMNEEYQGIDVNELDTVSENINEEFEKLLELKYQD